MWISIRAFNGATSRWLARWRLPTSAFIFKGSVNKMAFLEDDATFASFDFHELEAVAYQLTQFSSGQYRAVAPDTTRRDLR
jgi:hypothetical protein